MGTNTFLLKCIFFLLDIKRLLHEEKGGNRFTCPLPPESTMMQFYFNFAQKRLGHITKLGLSTLSLNLYAGAK